MLPKLIGDHSIDTILQFWYELDQAIAMVEGERWVLRR